MRKATVTTALSLLSILLLTACVAGPEAAVQITGAVQRDLSEGQVFYEDTPGGRQIYLHKMGPGSDMLVLDVLFPPDITPGQHPVTTSGPVNAAYYEYVDGVSRRFDVHVQGTLTVRQAGDRFTGELALTALPATGEAAPINLTGSFGNVPLNRAGIGGPQALGSLAALVLLGALVVLLVVNFGLQFYVGRQVYGAEGNWVFRSLRGTRTFIRGWQLPDQRLIMVLWSVALGTLLLCILLVVLMRA